jgi:hypothetical protein
MRQRVFVYWNLHKDVYSLRGTDGRVVAHTSAIHIADASFPVSQSGREQVLASGHKNVHAGVRGSGQQAKRRPHLHQLRGWRRVTYNPHKYDSFITASDERPVVGASEVWMVIVDGRPRVYARGIEYKSALAA